MITEEVATILEIVATINTKVETIVNLESNIFKNDLIELNIASLKIGES